MLSGERGINSPQKNWIYLMLALSGKVKTPPPKKTQVSLETTLHKVDFKKNLYSRETERKKKGSIRISSKSNLQVNSRESISRSISILVTLPINETTYRQEAS